MGHGVHDEEALSTALPPGQRRSGRASVRGEMSTRVVGDLASDEEGDNGAGSGRFGMGSRLSVRGPIRERSSPRMTYLGGGGRGGGGDGGGGGGCGGGVKAVPWCWRLRGP